MIPSIPLVPACHPCTCGICTRRGMGRGHRFSCRPIGGESPPRLLDRPMGASLGCIETTRNLWSRLDTSGPQNHTDATLVNIGASSSPCGSQRQFSRTTTPSFTSDFDVDGGFPPPLHLVFPWRNGTSKPGEQFRAIL